MTQPHTPAPWHVDQQFREDSSDIFIRAAHDTVICEIIGGTLDEFDEEEREANARLIAAAPGLLAALEAALPFMPEWPAKANALAAVAKAKGESM